jgi:hypothetical protein
MEKDHDYGLYCELGHSRLFKYDITTLNGQSIHMVDVRRIRSPCGTGDRPWSQIDMRKVAGRVGCQFFLT